VCRFYLQAKKSQQSLPTLRVHSSKITTPIAALRELVQAKITTPIATF
jgi:hypothetical protein